MDVLIRRGLIGVCFFIAQFFVILKITISARKGVIAHNIIYMFGLFLLSTYAYGLFNETIRYTPFGIIFYGLLGLLSSLESGIDNEEQLR
jgi:hypothetical protein